MTRDRTLLEGQIDCLRQSMLLLGSVVKDLSLDPQLVEKLAELSDKLSFSGNQPSKSVGMIEALEILPQARTSLNLLEGAGYVDRTGDGDGFAQRFRDILHDLEEGIGRELRRRSSAKVYGLYVIIDPEVTGGRDPVEVARGALKGGAKMLQLRDKLREKGQTLPLARALKGLCVEYDALLMINDHADLAALVGADGLHLGQGDLPVSEVRRILHPQQIVGRSNHLPDELLESQAHGADHVALGAIYPTATKSSIRSRATLGPDAVRKARESVNVPLVAIGGINVENVEPVVMAGADAVCVTGAVGLAADPEEASRRLVEKILGAGGKA